jgi:predicted AAA+ superfamily ATPase
LVAQNDVMLYYWSSGNKSEIDFIFQIQADIISVEVKSETRISGKSLSAYSNKYYPSYRIHISMNNLKETDGLVSCPIPLTDWLSKMLP